MRSQAAPTPANFDGDTRRTLQDLVRYLPSAVVPSLLGFVAVAVFTRLLSPEAYGGYTLVYTTVMFVHTCAFSWINQAALRYYERYQQGDAQGYFSTALLGFLTVLIVVSLAWFALSPLVARARPQLQPLLLLGPPLILFYSGGNLVLAFLRAMRCSLRYSLLSAGNAVLKVLAGLLFILSFNLGAAGILLGMIAAGAVVFLPETLRLIHRFRPDPRRFRTDLLVAFARYGLPVVGMAFVNIILAASDRYFIEYFMGSAAVGIYSAAYRITESSIMVFVSFLMLAAFPALIAAHERGGDKAARHLMRDLLALFMLLVTPVLTGVVVLSEEIIGTLLGPAYFSAHRLVPWIAGGAFWMGLCMYYNKSFELKEQTLILLGLSAAAALVNVGLNVALIPRLGLQGAAISTFAAYGCCFLLSMTAGSRRLRWAFPWLSGAKAMAGCLLMAMALLVLPDSPWKWFSLAYKVFSGGAVYLAAMLLVEPHLRVQLTETFARSGPAPRKAK
jgi:O-antigen/teichoic acid export membrane protein